MNLVLAQHEFVNEHVIDSWPIWYESPNKKKYYGLLTVTTTRLLYKPYKQYTQPYLEKEMYFMHWDCNPYIIIPKSQIASINTKNTWLNKRVVLTLNNNTTHVLNKTMLNVKHIKQALQLTPKNTTYVA